MNRIKIKYITNVRIPTPRAHGYAIMKMCSEFADNGAEVSLIVPGKSNANLAAQIPFDFYGLNKNFEIKRISSFDFLGQTLKFGKILYWLDVLSFFIFARLKIEFGKDEILYTRDFLTLLFFSKKYFFCLELHDITSKNFLFRQAIKKPRLFFVLNQNLKDDLIDMGVPESKIFISPSGVDVEKFDINLSKEEARKRLSQDPTSPFASLGLRGASKKIVLYSGQFYSWKGAETLAEAADLVPEAQFIFVGGLEPELSKFKAKYQNKDNIYILPFQERLIIPTYLKAADILVLPNSASEETSLRYTSPLKLLEYMAARRPIVASDLPSVREIVDESDCIFAKPENPQSFASAIKNLLANNQLVDKITNQASLDVKKYAWSARVKNIISTISHELH